MVSETVAAKLDELHGTMTLRAIVAEYGLRPQDIAPISRLLAGARVSPSVVRRIGRALGCVPPPRKLFRPVCTREEWEEFQEWKRFGASGLCHKR